MPSSYGTLEIWYGCVFDGVLVRAALTARTTVDNASADLGLITGADGFGSSHTASDEDFDKGETFDLDRNRIFGSGSFLYTSPTGSVVSVSYGFFSPGGTGCVARGVVVGG